MRSQHTMNDTLIVTLLDKFSASSVTELDLQDGTARLILRKERAPLHAQNLPDEEAPLPADSQVEVSPGADVLVAAVPTALGEPITSPMVATFFASPSPDAPPFVVPGSLVKAGDTLCILEAMKMMNRLEADFDGE
ncbi:MAG: acetyl-CoA carboxylase biotin carboxyl carrier protein subunit, partial [Treponema sp.]|nr:acetyl-CoA carboxylase biotin carboxyl carrier protein subunit [Treponema sp.]